MSKLMSNCPYFLQYVICTTFIAVLWAVLDALLNQDVATVQNVLVVGFALTWSQAKERERSACPRCGLQKAGAQVEVAGERGNG